MILIVSIPRLLSTTGRYRRRTLLVGTTRVLPESSALTNCKTNTHLSLRVLLRGVLHQATVTA